MIAVHLLAKSNSSLPDLTVGIVPEANWFLILIAQSVLTILVAAIAIQFHKMVHINQELIKFRLSLIRRYSKDANSLFCIFNQVGHFRDLDPEKVLQLKRRMEQMVHSNRAIFSKSFFEAHTAFMSTAFIENQEPGQPATIRCDPKDLTPHLSAEENEVWRTAFANENYCTKMVFNDAHARLQKAIAKQVGGAHEW